jgi:hypothetical protein
MRSERLPGLPGRSVGAETAGMSTLPTGNAASLDPAAAARRDEVIPTLLLNQVALNLVLHLFHGAWADPVSSVSHSERFEDAERLSPPGWQTPAWRHIPAGRRRACRRT